MKTFEKETNLNCVKKQKHNASLLIKKNVEISDFFRDCTHLTKFNHLFYKIQRKQHEGQVSAKRLQLGHGGCHFFERLPLKAYTFRIW